MGQRRGSPLRLYAKPSAIDFDRPVIPPKRDPGTLTESCPRMIGAPSNSSWSKAVRSSSAPTSPAPVEATNHQTWHHQLFSALNVTTGEATGECYYRRESEEFLVFMNAVAAKYANRELHVVVDNLGTHFTTTVREWLADLGSRCRHNPRQVRWIESDVTSLRDTWCSMLL